MAENLYQLSFLYTLYNKDNLCYISQVYENFSYNDLLTVVYKFLDKYSEYIEDFNDYKQKLPFLVMDMISKNTKCLNDLVNYIPSFIFQEHTEKITEFLKIQKNPNDFLPLFQKLCEYKPDILDNNDFIDYKSFLL